MAGTVLLTGKHAQVAEKMLREVTEILENKNIPYVLEGGTLLGIVRENRLLPWDSDIDLTITRAYARKLLAVRWLFWLKGYRTRIRPVTENSTYFTKGAPRLLKIQTRRFLFFKGIGIMDIFIKDLIEERYYWTVSKKKVLKSVPRHFYEQLGKFTFQGKSYNIPAQYDQYLQLRYGDWRTPVKEWDFITDDLSIQQKQI